MDYQEIAKQLSFEEKEGIFVKKINEYYLYLKDWEYMVLNIPSIFVYLDKELTKEELKRVEIAALNNACSIDSVNNKKNILIVSLPEGKKDEEYFNKCNTIIERVIKILSNDGYGPGRNCPLCDKEGEYHRYLNHYVPLHSACRDEKLEEVKKICKLEDTFSKHYVFAVLLSLIVGIVGLIPACLCVYYNYEYFSPLLILVSLFIVGINFLIKTPRNKKLMLVLNFIPVVLIVIFNIFSLPYMARGNEMTFLQYLISDFILGIRKILFTTLLSFGGFGLNKTFAKFLPNNQKEKELLEAEQSLYS